MSLQLNGTAGVTYNDGSNQPAAASPYGLKNLIINGDMRIDQRNAGASQAVTTSDAYFIDRFIVRGMTGSGHTAQQVSDAPNNFNNSAKFTVGTGGSPISTDRNYLSQRIEGYNFADLAFGTSAAKTITISFWVKSSLTGTFGGSIVNGSSNRSYTFTYTISSANTWEQKSITIVGDTSGTWLISNNIGSYVYFDLGSGTTYQGTSGTWAAADDRAATGATPIVGTSGATFYLTGVQLEIGDTATPFENRMYSTELAMCQRYYEKSFVIETAPADGVYTQAYLANVPYTDQWVLCAPYIPFKVEKRVTPTVVYYGSSGKWQVNNASNSWVTFAAVYSTGQGSSGINAKGMSVTVHNNGSSGYAVSSARTIRGDWTASAEL